MPGPCSHYRGDALSFCLAERAGDDVSACSDVGAFEADCRLRWVRRHAEEPLEVLLDACATEECRFDALESKATGSLLAELAACDAHLDAMAPYCREHAALRWTARGDDLDAVMAHEGWDEDLGRALGHWHACSGGPACDALPGPKREGCELLVGEVVADPSICTR